MPCTGKLNLSSGSRTFVADEISVALPGSLWSRGSKRWRWEAEARMMAKASAAAFQLAEEDFIGLEFSSKRAYVKSATGTRE
jgi:hypothetical protein